MSEENKTEPIETQTEPQAKVYPEQVVKDLIKQRDEYKQYKAKVEEYEELIKQAQDEKLKENEDYKTLLDNKERELAEIKKQKEEVSEYKTKYEDLDKSIRDGLLKQLPDELLEVAEELSTVKLQRFVELNKDKTPGMDNGKPGKGKINIDNKKWDDFSTKDLELIRETDFDGYSRLYKQKYGRQPS